MKRFGLRLSAIIILALSLVAVHKTCLQAVIDETKPLEAQAPSGAPGTNVSVPPGMPEAAKPTKAEYAPNEIIVKFKKDAGEKIRKELSAGLTLPANITSIAFLDNLNNKYKVKEIAPVFKELHRKLISTGKDGQAIFEEIKNKYPARAKRAPKDGRPPEGLENIYLIKTEGGQDVLQMVSEYKKDPNIEYAEPNYIARIQMVPNDPYYSSTNSWGQGYDDLWGLKKINAAQAWDISQGEGVVVAVVDTGIDYNHEDIAANIWINTREIPNNNIDDDNNGYIDDVRGWEFPTPRTNGTLNPPDNDPNDTVGHGTHVAGTIAALGNNGKGVIGVAPQAKVMGLKALNFLGGTYSSLAEAIRYAADNGADVINNSWGGSRLSSLISESMRYAYEAGCIIVVAAGNNNGPNTYASPSSLHNVISVAASDANDNRAWFSSYGTRIDVAAPGVGVLSLRAAGTDMYGGGSHIIPQGDANGKYYWANGTSMSAPHVSGACALLLSKYPNFSLENIRQNLRRNADDICDNGWDIYSGYGRINAFRSLTDTVVSSCRFLAPDVGAHIKGQVLLSVSAAGPYSLWYGEGISPLNWSIIADNLSGNYLWNTTGLVDGVYSVKATINAETVSDRLLLYLANSEHPGWPKVFDDMVSFRAGTPVISDLDGDGTKEIIFAGNSDPINPDGSISSEIFFRIYVYRGNGELYPGWPVEIRDMGQLDSVVAIGDIAGDSKKEIIIVTTWGYVYAFSASGMPLPGLNPLPLPYGYSSYIIESPLLFDINNDAKQEIFVRCWDKVISKDKIYILSGSGEILYCLESIDEDFFLESCIGFINSQPYLISPTGYGRVYTWDMSGRLLEGFPKQQIDNKVSGLSAINFNQREPRLFLGGATTERVDGDVRSFDIAGDNHLIGINGNGEQFGSWPSLLRNTFIENISFLRGNGEYLVFSYGVEFNRQESIEENSPVVEGLNFYLWDMQGNLITGWPKFLTNEWGQKDRGEIGVIEGVSVDIDNDGSEEIIIGGGYYNQLHAFKIDGTDVSGWPKYFSPYSEAPNSAAIDDIDNDGKLEIVASASNRERYYNGRLEVNVWDTDSLIEGAVMTWPQYRQNPQHTANINIIDATAPTTTDSGIDGLWHTSPVTVTLTAQDNADGLGIDNTYYSIDGSVPTIVYAGPFTISEPGTYTIKYYSVDKTGNREEVKTAANQVKITTVPGFITPFFGRSNPNEEVNFTATYLDPDGWQDIKDAFFLVNSAIDARYCFYGYYEPRSNKLFLRNDAGTYPWLGGFAPGSANVIENSYAKLDCAKTTVSGSGETLTVNWAVTFKSTFSGAKNLYLYVRDIAGVSSGWVDKGDWVITNKPPSTGTITPSFGTSTSGQYVTFTATYLDPDGWQNIKDAFFLVNSTISAAKSSFIYYDQKSNKLFLRNDAGTYPWLGGFAPGSSNVIENSYAKLDCAGTTVSGSGKTLTVNWRIAFKSAFIGEKNTYLNVRDVAGDSGGWSKIGSWNIIPEIIILSPEKK